MCFKKHGNLLNNDILYMERLKCGQVWEDRGEDKRKGTTYQDPE